MENLLKQNDQEPQDDWEVQGREALGKSFDVLFEESRKLRGAASHYLDSYQGEDKPGVSSSLESVKNASVYERAASENPAVRHMIDTATELVAKVQTRLVVIRAIEDGSKDGELNRSFEDAKQKLTELLAIEDRDVFDQATYRVLQVVKNGANVVTGSAASAQSASQSITSTAQRESAEFDGWWNQNYDENARVTITEHAKILRRFSQNAADKAIDLERISGNVSMNVGESVTGPLEEFIAKLRTSKF